MIRGKSRPSCVLPGALLVALLSSCADAPPGPGPGVSRELADRRARILSEVDYTFELRIPRDPEAPIRGRAVIEVTWTDPDGAPLVVDFDAPERRVRSLTVNGRKAAWTPSDDHLLVDPTRLEPHGRNRVEIEFVTGDGAGLHRDTALVYTLFVPDHGHGSLPLFDQPDLKATVAWRIDAPEGWRVVANAPATGPAPEGPHGRRWTFARSRPIPTYVMAFAAGRLDVREVTGASRTVRVLHRSGGATPEAVADVVEAHLRSLDWMEAYTGVDYPFEKLDVVAIPGLGFAGMEHPGVVFYRAEALFPSTEPGESGAGEGRPATLSRAVRRARAELVAHETAHMWFGNLVTMAWFDDAWMKEVLADFMARRIVELDFPDPDGDLRFLLTHHGEAYDADGRVDAVPIRRPLDNLRDAEGASGALVHRKAPIVLAHLERTLGADVFRTAVRSFVRTHAGRSADWNDLVAHLERAHGADLAAWSRAWVEGAGRPAVRMVWEPSDGGRGAVVLVQEHGRAPHGLWPQRLTVHGEWGGRSEWTPVHFDGVTDRVVVWEDVQRPDRVIPNASGLEYGLFRLDDGWTRALMRDLPHIRPSLVRAAAALLLRDALEEGRVPPAALLDAALAALDRESNDLVAAELVDLVGLTYHRHLSDAERAAFGSRVSSGLLGRIEGTRSRTLRSGLVDAWQRSVLAGIVPGDVATRLGEPPVEGVRRAPPAVSPERLTELAVHLATHRPILR